MPVYDLGRIAPVVHDSYNPATTYDVLDIVPYTDGNTYMAKGPTTRNVPTNTTYWALLFQGVADTAAQIMTKIRDLIHPVGSIYMSVTNTNPGTFYGGTWVAWGSGRVPVGVDTTQTEFDTVEETGGAKTHTLSAAEMPTHGHSLYNSAGTNINFPAYAAKDNGYASTSAIQGNGTNTATSGGGGAHNNLQPYITCYMWKRTA